LEITIKQIISQQKKNLKVIKARYLDEARAKKLLFNN